MDEARSRYERGKQLYEEGAFDAALIEFQRAYDLAPSYKILFNIGQVHRQRNDYASALRIFERYLKEGGAELDAKRKGEVEKEIAQLKGRVATLQITTNVPGAEILIDDESVGKTPLAQGILVNSGKRKITATKEGRVPTTKVFNVAGSDTMKITLDLAEPTGNAATPPPSATSTATPPPSSPSTTSSSPTSVIPEKPTPWLAWTITGALGVGAAVTGILALGASNDLKDKRSQPDVSRKDLDDGSSRTKTLALVSDLLLVGTVVAGGAAIYLTVSEPSKESAARGKGPVRLGVGPGSMILSGRFLPHPMIDATWEEVRTLPDGTEILLRMLRPDDAEALRAGFERLSPESRYRRFLSALPSLSDEMVRYFTQVDGDHHLAIVAGVVSPDLKSEEGIAVARFVRLPEEPDVAEAAVTVIDAFQGKGIGKLLLTTLVRAAAERGIRKFRAEVLPSNVAVQGLLASVGAVERERSDECVVYDIPIPVGDEQEHHWQALFELLKHAASSVALVFRHWWFGRRSHEKDRD